MIFYVDTETRKLSACAEEVVLGEGELLGVEAAQCLFWNDQGSPLEPVFTVPNKRGLFSATNGEYKLVPAAENHHADLLEVVDEIAQVEMDARGLLFFGTDGTTFASTSRCGFGAPVDCDAPPNE